MRVMKWAVALVAVAGLSAAHAQPPGAKSWLGSWGASPLAPNLVDAPRAPISPRYNGQSVRQVVRLSAGGSQVRIRLSNEFGQGTLMIGAAHVAVSAGPDGAIVPGSDRVVTFSRQTGAAVPKGAPLISDPVDLPVAPLTSLTVSLYFPTDTGPCTCHQLAVQTGYVSGPGDFTAAARFPTASRILSRTFLMGVEVLAPAQQRAVAAFGDSLTDGAVSTPDGNHRWPDRLAERLKGSWGIVNEGISGNQLLADGAGQSGLARFDRDVLTVPGLGAVVVMLGTNDLGIGYGPATAARPAPAHPPTVQDIQAADRQLIARAHGKGVKIYGATIPPFEGASYWSPAGDAVREAVNAWIRRSGEFDGVLDFDAAWRDPAHPAQIKPGFNAPDHLHGSDTGYAALGDAIDLKLFR